MGRLSGTLLQTCKLPHPLNHRCLCRCLWALCWVLTGQAQIWQARRVQPNNWRSSQETEETSVSSQMSGNEGGEWGPESCSRNPGVQFNSVAQSCPTLCDPMNRSTPGLPVHHQLPEFTQTHVPRISDAIQPSHPLSSPSPPVPNPSQHQSLFQ